jgi:LacI family transcriptional regulator
MSANYDILKQEAPEAADGVKPIFTITLADRDVLEHRVAFGSQTDVERAKIVLLRALGYTREQLVTLLGCSPRRISFWVSRYRKHGLSGLDDQPKSQIANTPHQLDGAPIELEEGAFNAPESGLELESVSRNGNEAEPAGFEANRGTEPATKINKVTMRKVAEVAGVCKMSVSRVLNDHPSVSPRMKQRVLSALEKTGYRRNPEIDKLMAHLRPQRINRLQGVICSIEADLWRSRNDGVTNWHFEKVVNSARQRAEALGFSWETYSLEAFLARPAHTAKVLYHRGVEGVFISPPPLRLDTSSPEIFVDKYWEDFAVVSATHAFNASQIQRVSHDYFQNMTLVYHNLMKRGYKRIGLAMLKDHDTRGRRLHSGAYLACQADSELSLRPFYYHRPIDSGALQRWFDQERPDAIIVSNRVAAREISELLGITFPGRIAVAALSLPDATVAGIDEFPEKIGTASSDILTGMILRNKKGLSTQAASVTMVPGAWRDGESVAASVTD